MKKYVYLFAACCIFAASVLPAAAGPGCCSKEKKCEKKVEAICLTLDELEDGKAIDVGDEGKLTMKQDGDAWTFTLTDLEGKEDSVFTIMTDSDEPQMVKIVTTSEGDNVWTSVTTGEEAMEGGHHAVFIGEGGEHDKNCNVFVSGDDKVICKQFETVHCGQAYTCEKCGLVISVPEEKDKGAYTCPNDETAMKKSDRSKEIKKKYAYKVVTKTETVTDTDVEKE